MRPSPAERYAAVLVDLHYHVSEQSRNLHSHIHDHDAPHVHAGLYADYSGPRGKLDAPS